MKLPSKLKILFEVKTNMKVKLVKKELVEPKKVEIYKGRYF